jgi:hypothetical protein
MKRYWKVAVLVPFIVLCIGTYYINAASTSYPDYYLKTQAGDEKEVSGISLQANYTNQSLAIHSEGSVYQSEESFWDSLNSRYYNVPAIAKLRKEHRQFMRGKDNPASFYEDDKVLSYVEIESKYIPGIGQADSRFIVSDYDKEQNRSSSFKVTVPQENDYQWINICDVQIVGRTLNLITMNTKNNEARAINATYTEVHLYKLDLDQKNIAADQIILSGDSANLDERIEIRSVFETVFTKPNRYSVFQITHSKKEERKVASGFISTGIQELVYYDLESSRLVPIQAESINELIKKSDNLTISYSHNELMLTYLKDPNAVRVIRYSLAENKVKSDLTIDTKHSLANGERLTFAVIAKNRLYMIGSLKHETFGVAPSLVIADLDTGGILYEGYISRKDNKEISDFEINNILIQ